MLTTEKVTQRKTDNSESLQDEETGQAYIEKGIEVGKLIVFFLYDDEDQSVHVEEVEDIDFAEMALHLNLGGSVFITHRRKPEMNIKPRRRGKEKNFKDLRKPWYFAHI